MTALCSSREPGRDLAQLTAVRDHNGLPGGTALAADLLNSCDDIHAFGDHSEDDVLAIQPSGVSRADKELGSIGVRAGVGHGQGAHALMLEHKVLILELLPVDGLAPSAVSVREVSSLQHELRDHTVNYDEHGTTTHKSNNKSEIKTLDMTWKHSSYDLLFEEFWGREGIHTSATFVAEALLASAESSEVLGGLGHDIAAKLHDDAAGRDAADGDVEEDLGKTHSE